MENIKFEDFKNQKEKIQGGVEMPISEQRQKLEQEIEKIHKEDISKMEKKRDKFEKRIVELIRESVKLLAEDPNTEWRRMPYIGKQDGLGETNSREYRAKIGDNYELELSWYNYPEDVGTIGQPETYTESFYVKIKGKYGFPYITIDASFNQEGNLDKSHKLRHFNEETQKQIQNEVVELGRRVKEKLG